MSQNVKGVMMDFEDIAVQFTEDEWSLLDKGQRALHRDVMEENVATLISLADYWSDEVGSRSQKNRIHKQGWTIGDT
ncbi:hypothetical protein JRQ81_000017 [Phrynocephalus forsythii]|uniref:KRAB domain-containing protein n=1 Tax=Phrynocephalus forsythii TaxID=171643 RepID=A0A9Q0X574_9SAUR|nr:hypothetical protein JRQ81_000017 [Phrynocephalus forsythii]